MTALAADTRIDTRNRTITDPRSFAMKSNITIYQGSLVVMNTSGTAEAGVDTANFRFLGLADRNYVNPSGGSVQVGLEAYEQALLTHDGNIAATDVGTICEVLDSGTVCNAAQSTNHVKVGRVIEWVSSTQVWVSLLLGNP